MTPDPSAPKEQMFGHPPGLFVLFFAEMWERFSYYGMRALLVFYMIKGFLGFGDKQAYAVYGAYTALVYATPFIGGILADKVLGARRAGVIGGVLMAGGHLLMTIESRAAFFGALGLLIVGNGFFKPNVSTMVGSLYGGDTERKDAGFTLFYMGINLGAAMAPLLCGYVGERFGWHYGFGLATIGMLIGLAVFVAPVKWTQLLISLGAVGTAFAMFWASEGLLKHIVNGFVAVALLAAAVIAYIALGPGKRVHEVANAFRTLGLFFGMLGWIATAMLIWGDANPMTAYAAAAGGAVVLILVYIRLVWSTSASQAQGHLLDEVGAPPPNAPSGFAVFGGLLAGTGVVTAGLSFLVRDDALATYTLNGAGGLALLVMLYIIFFRTTHVERHRLLVVLVMMVFSMIFWAFFEQAGTSLNNFADRNVDRVNEERTVQESDVGSTIKLELNQEQLGYMLNGEPFTIDKLDKARANDADVIDWPIERDHVGMGIGGAEISASEFQSANPIFILIFGLVFSALWSFLGARGREPSTPTKFALGLIQLGLGFGAIWYGAQLADERGMVDVEWLLLGYLLHTTGELCLSPVGLSMVTKLSPKRIVSMVMGAWFMGLAFSNYLASVIAMMTGVSHGNGKESSIPVPLETVHVYADVFGQIALAATVAGAVVFVLGPFIRRGMHAEKPET